MDNCTSFSFGLLKVEQSYAKEKTHIHIIRSIKILKWMWQCFNLDYKGVHSDWGAESTKTSLGFKGYLAIL